MRCILLVRAASLAGPDVAAATVLTLSRDRTPYLLSISLTTKHLSIRTRRGRVHCNSLRRELAAPSTARALGKRVVGGWLCWL